MMIFAPSALTAFGLLLGLVGILSWPSSTAPAALLASLAFDVADGATARRFGVVTKFGGEFDWQVDCLLSYFIAWTVFADPWRIVATLLLLALQVVARGAGMRISGRAFITVAVVGWLL